MNKEILKIVEKIKDRIDIGSCGTIGEDWKYNVRIKGDINFARAMFTPISRYEKEKDAQIDCIMYLIIEGIASTKHIKGFDVVSDINFFKCVDAHWCPKLDMKMFMEDIELWKESDHYYEIFTQTCALVNLVKTTLTKEDRECIGKYVLNDAYFKEVVNYYKNNLVSYRGLRLYMRGVYGKLGELAKPNLYFNNMIVPPKNNVSVTENKEKECVHDCEDNKSTSLLGYDYCDNYMLSILKGSVVDKSSSETIIDECEDVEGNNVAPTEDIFQENMFVGGYSEEYLIAAEASYLEEQSYLEQYHGQYGCETGCNYDDLFNEDNLDNSEDNFVFNNDNYKCKNDCEDSLDSNEDIETDESIKQESIFDDSILNCEGDTDSQVDFFSLNENNVPSEVNIEMNVFDEKSNSISEVSVLEELGKSNEDVPLKNDCVEVKNDDVMDENKYSVVEYVDNEVTYETKILDDIDNVILFKVTFDIEKLNIAREVINKSLELLQLELVSAVQRQSVFNELTETMMALNIVLGKLAVLKDSHSDSIRLSILELEALLYGLKKIKIYEFDSDSRNKIEYLENLIEPQCTLPFERKVEYNEWIKNKSHSSIMRILFEYK